MPTPRSLLGLLALVCLAVVPLGCSGDAQSKSPEDTPDPVIPVEAAAVTRGEIAAFFAGTATLEAEDEALVVAKAGGIVEAIYAEEGDYVRRGDTLAQLDDERLALELARAEVTLRQVERLYLRNKELHEKQLISAEEYERVRSDFESQSAAVDLSRLAVAHTTVRAPFSGIVSERLIKLGNMLQTHTAAFRLTDFDPLLAILHVPERELNKLRRGQAAELRVDALPGETFAGRINRISPVVDPATGTFKVTVEVRDRSRRLKPGMFGRVAIVYDTHTDALLIPKQAVIEEDDASSVYVIRDGMAFRQDVRTGYTDRQHVELIEGIAEGDLLITTGQGNLRDSTKVEVIR